MRLDNCPGQGQLDAGRVAESRAGDCLALVCRFPRRVAYPEFEFPVGRPKPDFQSLSGPGVLRALIRKLSSACFIRAGSHSVVTGFRSRLKTTPRSCANRATAANWDCTSARTSTSSGLSTMLPESSPDASSIRPRTELSSWKVLGDRAHRALLLVVRARRATRRSAGRDSPALR